MGPRADGTQLKLTMPIAISPMLVSAWATSLPLVMTTIALAELPFSDPQQDFLPLNCATSIAC